MARYNCLVRRVSSTEFPDQVMERAHSVETSTLEFTWLAPLSEHLSRASQYWAASYQTCPMQALNVTERVKRVSSTRTLVDGGFNGRPGKDWVRQAAAQCVRPRRSICGGERAGRTRIWNLNFPERMSHDQSSGRFSPKRLYCRLLPDDAIASANSGADRHGWDFPQNPQRETSNGSRRDG